MPRKSVLPKELELTISGLSSHAEGVGRYEGKVIFVEGALPGEKVKIKIIHDSRKMARAVVKEILSQSPDRIIPPCPYYENCGGCQFQHFNYKQQLEYKRQTVKDAIRHVGNLDLDPNPVIYNEQESFYRNKMTFPLTVRDGKIKVGLHRRNSYQEIVPLDNCLLLEKPMQELLYLAMERLNQVYSTDEVYDFQRRTGNLRFLGIRSFAGKLVLLLVVREFQPDKIEKLNSLWSHLPNWATTAVFESSDVNEYDWGIRPAKFISGQETYFMPYKHIAGQAQPLTFLQTNTRMTERLYDYVLSLPVEKKDALLDGYCGIGLFSMVLSEQYQHVIGIDTDMNAIASAQHSAEKQHIDNIQFIAAPVEHALRIFANPLVPNPKQLRQEVAPLKKQALEKLGKHIITAAILDPPRAGLHPKVIKRLGEIKPSDIIMVSCHPATMARDLSGIISLGYKVLTIQPFDMFPQTFHVETVVHLRA